MTIKLTSLEPAQDPCMCWHIVGEVDGIPFEGELSRDMDYAPISGPDPTLSDDFTTALGEDPIFQKAEDELAESDASYF